MLDDGSVGAPSADGEQHVAVAGTEERKGGGEAFWIWTTQWEGKFYFGSTNGFGNVKEFEAVMTDLCDCRNPMLRAKAGSSSVLVEGDDPGVSRSRWWLRCESYLRARLDCKWMDGRVDSLLRPLLEMILEWSTPCNPKSSWLLN